MKILVVDDDQDFRALVPVLLRRSYPQVAVADYDPRVKGLPPDDFPWADFDVVMLDHELHAEHTGLDWLRRYARLPGFPAIIFTTGAGDENLAARAMKFGADEYLSKRDLTAERLGELVSSVIAERSTAGQDELSAAGLPAITDEGEAKVPGFELRRLLGCGGTADVYLAERQRDGLTVVLKILREGMAHDTLANRRLESEAVSLVAIDSAHVVRVYEHGIAHGRAYMIMEFLGHGDLSSRIEEGLSTQAALTYVRSIARGLSTIHAHGIVHRDMKPSNIMFRYDDSLALTDFGIALHAQREETFTESGSVVGTPTYMSPEQCEGERADERSDLYSLGVMLFEMLDGSRPYKAESVSQLFVQHVESPVPLLPPQVMHLQPLVDRLMDKNPDRRYASAQALVDELDSGTWESAG